MHPSHFSEDINVLFDGLEDGVDYSGTVGILTIFGPTAFPILVGKYQKDGSRQPIGAASRFGEGRIVAFSHDCYTHPEGKRLKLLQNCVTWTAIGENLGTSTINIGLIGTNAELEEWTKTMPFNVKSLHASDVKKDSLDAIDVVILVDHDINRIMGIVSIIQAFVKKGGGLVTAATGWAFDGEISQFPLNLITHEAGFGWTKEYDVVSLVANTQIYPIDISYLRDTHAGDAWKLLLLHNSGDLKLKDDRLEQMKAVHSMALANLSSSHPLVEASGQNTVANYNKKDLGLILQGLDITGVEDPGYCGVLVIFGPNAFPIIVGTYSGDGMRHAVGGGAKYGNGRITAFSHDAFTNPGVPTQSKLLNNCIMWTASEGARHSRKLKVGVFNENSYMTQWIEDNEQTFKLLRMYEVEEIIEKLANLDVLILVDQDAINDSNTIEIVKTFVKNGGGLVTADTTWATNSDILKTHTGNLITRNAGIGFTKRFSVGPVAGSSSDKFSTNLDNLQNTNAGEAWDLLLSHMNEEFSLPLALTDQLGSIVDVAMDCLVNTCSTSLLGYMKSDMKLSEGDEIIPTPKNPTCTPGDKLKLKCKINLVYNSDDDKDHLNCTCHPATRFFPGLPNPVEPKTENYPLVLNLKNEGMYSTGLYALPGERINFKFSKPTEIPFKIQIGSHSDDISESKEWHRCPMLTIYKHITIGTTEFHANNTFGGLVYIVLDEIHDTLLEISVSGVILAPYFVLGKTTLDDWKKIRSRGAPWGELETNKFILTLPGPKLAQVEDPIKLMQYWDRVLDAQADLGGIPLDRPKAERMVADVQLGGDGYMHSGYPIMIHTDIAVDTALSLQNLLTENAWGHYHELGHNHQVSDWTFELVTEISNNMFALYVYNTVAGITFAQARPGTFEQDAINRDIKKYIKAGPDYNAWSDDPFLGLLFYVQLQKKYGWDAYKKVFRSYITLPAEDKPNSEQDKVDRWLVQFSNVVGENLSSLFRDWGIPISKWAENLISHLPATKETIQSMIV